MNTERDASSEFDIWMDELWGGVTPAALKIRQQLAEIAATGRAQTQEVRQRPRYATKKERRNAWFKERAARDPSFKLNRNTRHAINQSLNGTKRRRTWQSLVGYSLAELKAHLEAQFTEGMTWENIGEWHVDHIRPLSSFNITSAECDDFKHAWALSNLQPLWGPDNLKKGARWTP